MSKPDLWTQVIAVSGHMLKVCLLIPPLSSSYFPMKIVSLSIFAHLPSFVLFITTEDTSSPALE